MRSHLEDEIEFIRQKMLEAACRDGISAEGTMSLSQKLDVLMNQFDAKKKEAVVVREMNNT